MRGWAALLWVALSSCGSGAFVCADNAECSVDSAAGVCQPSGFCSFPDPACDSGQRYGDLAGSGLAGACVPETTEGTGDATAATPPASTTTTGDPTPPGNPPPTTTAAGDSSSASTAFDLDTGWTTEAADATGMSAGDTSTGLASTGGGGLCFGVDDCGDARYCEFLDGLCGEGMPGACVDVPEICPDIVDEQCGCDFAVHVNTCEANAAGVDIYSDETRCKE